MSNDASLNVLRTLGFPPLPVLYERALLLLINLVPKLPRVSIACHGSVATGEVSCYPGANLPLSDIDLLIAGRTMEDLKHAARHLAPLNESIVQVEAPTFQFSMKYRTYSELEGTYVTANELSALHLGRWFAAQPPVRSPLRSATWYMSEARRAILTRLHYDRDRWFTRLRFLPVYESYCPARTVLELPRAYLIARGIVPHGYAAGVREFLLLAQETQIRTKTLKAISDTLQKALSVRVNPSQPFMDFEAACVWLESTAHSFSVIDAPIIPRAFRDYCSSERPFDVRDIDITKGSRHFHASEVM